MKMAAEDFRKVLKSGDVTKIAEADVKFHDIIFAATNNQRLITLLNNLREQMYRFRVEYLKQTERLKRHVSSWAVILTIRHLQYRMLSGEIRQNITDKNV